MLLEELHEKIVKEVEKRIGSMDKIVNLENDVLIKNPNDHNYFGHFKSYPDFILTILYYDETVFPDWDMYPWYSLRTMLKDNGDNGFWIDIVDDTSKKDFSDEDFENAMNRINYVLNELKRRNKI